MLKVSNPLYLRPDQLRAKELVDNAVKNKTVLDMQEYRRIVLEDIEKAYEDAKKDQEHKMKNYKRDGKESYGEYLGRSALIGGVLGAIGAAQLGASTGEARLAAAGGAAGLALGSGVSLLLGRKPQADPTFSPELAYLDRYREDFSKPYRLGKNSPLDYYAGISDREGFLDPSLVKEGSSANKYNEAADLYEEEIANLKKELEPYGVKYSRAFKTGYSQNELRRTPEGKYIVVPTAIRYSSLYGPFQWSKAKRRLRRNYVLHHELNEAKHFLDGQNLSPIHSHADLGVLFNEARMVRKMSPDVRDYLLKMRNNDLDNNSAFSADGSRNLFNERIRDLFHVDEKKAKSIEKDLRSVYKRNAGLSGYASIGVMMEDALPTLAGIASKDKLSWYNEHQLKNLGVLYAMKDRINIPELKSALEYHDENIRKALDKAPIKEFKMES